MKKFANPACLAALPLALCAAFPAAAQTPAPIQLKEVVVTANRSEQSLTDTIPHTTVLGRDAIERSQATDLPSLLSREAGFQFTQNGGPGTSANFFLRGSASLQVLVLIDGVPLTRQDTTGTVGLEHLMLDQVERVEIVRGNVSAIYGSGAVGGVIQIFTRQGVGKPRGFAQLEVGSYGSNRANAGLSGSVDKTRFSLGVGWRKTDGFSAMSSKQYPNENPDRDGYSNRNYQLALSHDLAKDQTLGLRLQGSDGRFDFDGGGYGTARDFYKGSNKQDSWSVYSHNQVTADWRSELTLSHGRERSVYDARLTSYPYDSQAVTRSSTLNWTNTVTAGAWLLTLGGERQRQHIDTSANSVDELSRERSVGALFAGVAGSLGQHSMQFNLRRDAADGTASKTTGYAGYGYQMTPQWKLLASASSAFNLAPLGYLYDSYSGNPDLKPETARSAELGLQWAQDDQVLRATAFKTRIDELLQYDFSTFSFNNVSKSSNKGLEVSYSGKTAGADVRASLTLQDPTDETTGQRLIRRARTLASLGASLPVGPWALGGDLRYTGSRPDIPSRPSLSAYTLVDLTARYKLTPEVDLTARVENLFDRQYQTAYGYNQAGRSAFVGLVWNQK